MNKSNKTNKNTKSPYEVLAIEILKYLGGPNNIVNAVNCITRLRVVVKDKTAVNVNKIKELNGVLGLVNDGTIFQVILGPGKVVKVTNEINDLISFTVGDIAQEKIEGPSGLSLDADWKENKKNIREKGNKFKWLTRGIRHLANIFSPLIPAIIASGIFAAIASLLNQFGANNAFGTHPDLSPEEVAKLIEAVPVAIKALYYLFTAFSSGFIAYLVLACGYNAAKEFGASPMLGLLLGGICIATEITSLAIAIGLGQKDGSEAILKAGKGGVIGVILAALLLSVVEKFLHKKMPNSVDTVLTPFLSILIVGTVYVFGIMIATGFISDAIVTGISTLTMNNNIFVRMIAGFIAAALFLPLVMLGMHHGLVAFYIPELQSHGYISLYPVLAMAGAAQIGAAIALYIKSKKMKNEKLQKNILASIVPGICGVGEPLIYSVTLPLVLPFLTAGLGAAFGGAFIMAFQVGSTCWGPSGFIAIPLMNYVEGKVNPMGMFYYTMGLFIAIVGGFIFTWFIVKNKRVAPINRDPHAIAFNK